MQQLAVIHTRAQQGINAPLVSVEVHLSNGLPAFSIVGLAEKALKESKDRVRSAILNSQFDFPMRRITVNLAPADLPKEGGQFDLAIAIGILAASHQLPQKNLHQYEFIGELALSGELRHCSGCLPSAIACNKTNRTLFIPKANQAETALITTNAHACEHLLQVCQHITGVKKLPYLPKHKQAVANHSSASNQPDMADIIGQPHARRALEIAAAGGHSLLMVGPPGTGKTMLASRLPSILPPPTQEQSLDIAAIASLGGKKVTNDIQTIWQKRPFRAPHHTASAIALVGGGRPIRPGEISLAHEGVLFLDELPEFDRKVLEVLREPIESGHIVITRAAEQAVFPSKFQLIAAMNPCPCGYLGDSKRQCVCSTKQVQRYQDKLSGPFLDRIDMTIQVPLLDLKTLNSLDHQEESSVDIRSRVLTCRERQMTRNQKTNSQLSNKELNNYCCLSKESQQFILQAVEKLMLSARAYHRCLKVARTLADLDNMAQIEQKHLAEALSYRPQIRRINKSAA